MVIKYKRRNYFIVLLILLSFIIAKEEKLPTIEKGKNFCLYEKNICLLYDIKGDGFLIGFKGEDTVFPTRRKMEESYLYSAIFQDVDSVKLNDSESIIILYMDYKNHGKILNYILSHFLPLILLLIFLYKFKTLLWTEIVDNKFKMIILFFLAVVFLLFVNSILYRGDLINNFYFNFLAFLGNILVLGCVFYLLKNDSRMLVAGKKNYFKWYDILILLGFYLFYSLYYFTLEFPTKDAIKIMDTFHVGEVLYQYMGIKMGYLLYKDIFSVHGILSDPFITMMSMKLFGEGIGSYYIGNILWSSLATLILLFVVYKNCSRSVFYLFLFFVFLCGFRFYYFTDKYLFLYLIYLVERKRGLFAHILGFVFSYLSFLYSVEVGIASLGFMIVLTSLRKDFKGLFIGVLTGGFVFIIVLWDKIVSFLNFIVYVAVDYPHVFSFDILKMPTLYNIDISVMFILGVAGISLYLLFVYVKSVGIVESAYHIAFYISGFLSFLPALGRSDAFSIGVRIVPIILFLFIILNHYEEKYGYLILILLMFLYPYPDLELANIVNVIRSMPQNIKRMEFFVNNKNRKEYLLPNYYKAYKYLEKTSYVYCLSSEGIWYYLLKTPSYTRFMLPIFANRKEYQEEIISSLQKNKIPYIIFNKNIWSFYPEGKPFYDSRKIVWDYVNEHYVEDTAFSDIVILKRRR